MKNNKTQNRPLSYQQSVTYTYTYDNLGNLTSITDSETGHFLDYTDDGIVIKDQSGDGSMIEP